MERKQGQTQQKCKENEREKEIERQQPVRYWLHIFVFNSLDMLRANLLRFDIYAKISYKRIYWAPGDS